MAANGVMTLTETAEYLRCARSTIYRAIKQDSLPYFKMGSGYRFRIDSIDAWMNSRRADVQAKEIRHVG